jgi:hypothetical protein
VPGIVAHVFSFVFSIAAIFFNMAPVRVPVSANIECVMRGTANFLSNYSANQSIEPSRLSCPDLKQKNVNFRFHPYF